MHVRLTYSILSDKLSLPEISVIQLYHYYIEAGWLVEAIHAIQLKEDGGLNFRHLIHYTRPCRHISGRGRLFLVLYMLVKASSTPSVIQVLDMH